MAGYNYFNQNLNNIVGTLPQTGNTNPYTWSAGNNENRPSYSAAYGTDPNAMNFSQTTMNTNTTLDPTGGLPPSAAMTQPGNKGLNPLSFLPYGSAALGVLEGVGGLIGLSQMGDAPNYSVSGELQNSYNTAQEAAKRGLTIQEYQNALNNIAQQQNATRRVALDTGGGQLAQTIGGVLGADKLGATNELAAIDAKQRMANQQYLGTVASQIQTQKNLNTQQAIDQYNKKQAAYGGAVNSGLGQFTQFANQIGPALALTGIL